MRLEGDRRRKLPNRGAVLEGLYDDLARCRRQLDAAVDSATASLLTFPLPDLEGSALPFEELHTALMLMDCLALLLGLEETPWAATLCAALRRHPGVHDGRFDVARVYEAAPPRPPGSRLPRLAGAAELAAAAGNSAAAQLASFSMESATNSLVEQISALMLTASTRDGGDMAAAAAGAAASAGLARAAALSAEVGFAAAASAGGAGSALHGGASFAGGGSNGTGLTLTLDVAPAGSAAGAGALPALPAGQPSPTDIQQYVRQRADAQLMTHLRGLNRLVALRADMRSQCATLQARDR